MLTGQAAETLNCSLLKFQVSGQQPAIGDRELFFSAILRHLGNSAHPIFVIALYHLEQRRRGHAWSYDKRFPCCLVSLGFAIMVS